LSTEREDINVGFVSVTRKKMHNGEVRERITFADGLVTSRTTAACWLVEDGIPWQEAHYHMGLTEVYVLLTGWAWFITFDGEMIKRDELVKPGETITFKQNVPHVVVLGPGAQICTTQFGESVPNPNKNNKDWYPATEEVLLLLEQEQEIVGYLIRCSYSQTEPAEVPVI
jgi:mannose-6-phosphate isomerase-like protein (cupin superfamily)